MFGAGTIALAAAVGAAIFVYRKTSYRGQGDYVKQAAPAAIAGILTFLVSLTILWQIM